MSTEGSIPSIVDDKKTGFLLKENTPEEIASIIMKKPDWKKMGLAGREKFLKEFEQKNYEKKFLKIFKQLSND